MIVFWNWNIGDPPDCDWLCGATDCAGAPQIREPVRDPACFSWQGVGKVTWYYLYVGYWIGQEGRAMKGHMLDQGILDDVVRRIVEVAQPEKIILFGSAASGWMGPHSDLDLLIVKEGAQRAGLWRDGFTIICTARALPST